MEPCNLHDLYACTDSNVFTLSWTFHLFEIISAPIYQLVTVKINDARIITPHSSKLHMGWEKKLGIKHLYLRMQHIGIGGVPMLNSCNHVGYPRYTTRYIANLQNREWEMLLIPKALCWSSRKCNCACALPAKVQLRLRVTRRSWQKLFAGKNFVKILVTAQTQLRSYSEQQTAFGNSNICNCGKKKGAKLMHCGIV